MASFHAELHLTGSSYPVRSCIVTFSQATDARGRVVAKVRHEPLVIVLDVPHDDVLLDWAGTPHKALAGQVVFYETNQLSARETVAFSEGQCVGYNEVFESGNNGSGAYQCIITITAPSFELRAGGPNVAVALATRFIGGSGADEISPEGIIPVPYVPSESDIKSAAANKLGAAVTAAEVAAIIEDLDLKAMAKAINPEGGMTNCTHITEAVVARLRGIDPEAVAPDAAMRNLHQLEFIHDTKFDFDSDIHKAFRTIASSPEGTIGLLVMIPKTPDGMGHTVTIVNHKGVATIIEGQHRDAYNPAGIYTSSSWAETRYGDEDKVHLGFAILSPAEPLLA